MERRGPALVARTVGVLLVTGLAVAGCSGGDDASSSRYCDGLRQAKTDLSTLSVSNLGELDRAFTAVHRLTDEAPAAVKSDWATLDDAVTTIEDSLKQAGLTTDDLASFQAGDPPAGVSAADIQQVAQKLGELGGQDFAAASQKIQEHALDTCKVDLR